MLSDIKILYVDFDFNYGKKFLDFFVNENLNIKYFQNATDAINETPFFQPDILITDVYLGNQSCFDLIEKIKKINPQITIVILSDKVSENIFINAIEIKVDAFILKEKDFEYIKNKIKSFKIQNEFTFLDESSQKKETFDLGNNFIFMNYNMIKIGDNEIQLTPQESNLIKILINGNNGFVSYNILQNSLSSYITSIDTIRTVIRNIRKKTYDDIIINQSGLGYKLNHLVDINKKLIINDIQSINKKILIIKGNKNQNDTLAYKLSKFGFICESVNTLFNAKELLSIGDYDYIIADLHLPDGESVDFINKFNESIYSKLIMLSNADDIYYKDYLYFKGILDYIIEDDMEKVSNYIYQTISRIESNISFNNVLLIEKSKKICEQIRSLLKPRQYQIDIVTDVYAANEIIKNKSYSLIIVDINLDKCFDFVEKIKNKISKNINIIVLTDEQRNYSTVREAYSYGASECLRKPIFAEEFILKVDQLTDNSKLIYELKENKKLLNNYKKIVDQSAIISKTNKKGIITYVNKIFCDISGYDEEELIGRPHNIIRHPDTSNKTFENMWNTIKIKKQIWSGVIKNKAKNGTSYYVQTSIMPILDKDGNIEEFIALRNDISTIYKK